jgi:hypothetical protein
MEMLLLVLKNKNRFKYTMLLQINSKLSKRITKTSFGKIFLSKLMSPFVLYGRDNSPAVTGEDRQGCSRAKLGEYLDLIQIDRKLEKVI